MATCEITQPPAAGCGSCAQPATVRVIIPPGLVRPAGGGDARTQDQCCLCWDELRTQLIAAGHTITDTTGSVAQLRAEFPGVNMFRSDEGVLYAYVHGVTCHADLASKLRAQLEQVTVHAVTARGARTEPGRP